MPDVVLAFFRMQAPAGQGSPMLPLLLNVGGIILIIYFLFVRPQKKAQRAHEALVSELTKGDDVVTSGGIVGTIVKVEPRLLILQTGDARIAVERHRVSGRFKEQPAEEG